MYLRIFGGADVKRGVECSVVDVLRNGLDCDAFPHSAQLFQGQF